MKIGQVALFFVWIFCMRNICRYLWDMGPGDDEVTPTRIESQIPVFYNLFTPSQDDAEYVKTILNEQINMSLPQHKFFVLSIGIPLDVPNVITIRHEETGNEMDTLDILWKHCDEHPQDKVVYLHSKGSYHRTSDNDRLRRFLSQGALSDECANLPDTCNVCASRMSAVPHPHTSGNMWLAKCDYVKRLIRPAKFDPAMQKHKREIHEAPNRCDACIGLKRYAAEHWIYSHPSVKPCDLATDSNHLWSYNDIPDVDFDMKLMPAPRFELEAYKESCVFGKYIDYRLLEYRGLYGEHVDIPPDWFGWNHLMKDNSTMLEFGRNNHICTFINI